MPAASNTREKTGVVVSDKMQKTIVVKVVERRSHQRYKKIHIETIKFKAHDEQNVAKIGDTVRIVECRPLSRDKNWMLAEVLKHEEEV